VYVHRWIDLFKRFDTSGSSSDIENNWIYLDFPGLFIDGLTYSKDLVLRVLHRTLEIIGFIWIFLVCSSMDWPIQKI
jgi:hypothetical protein